MPNMKSTFGGKYYLVITKDNDTEGEEPIIIGPYSHADGMDTADKLVNPRDDENGIIDGYSVSDPTTITTLEYLRTKFSHFFKSSKGGVT